MKPTRAGDNWAHFDDGTCWSIPDDDSDDSHDTLAHIARYASDEKVMVHRYQIAGMLECYRHLIMLPQRERNARVKAIREAMAMRDAPSDASAKVDAAAVGPARKGGRG